MDGKGRCTARGSRLGVQSSRGRHARGKWTLLAFAGLILAAPTAAPGEIIRREQAQEIARQNGWVVRLETVSGVLELQAIVNGVPKYYLTHNANAADTVSTDECLPGGSSGLGLTGAGVTLGIWDAGGVRTTHQEYGGRATQIDSPASTHYHSTHVAGTMIASGVVAAAKGMSPAADLDCYDWNDDETEMRTAAAGGLRVSNHSYGYITGWYWSSGSGAWFWYGDRSVSTVEDHWFGLYTVYTEEMDDIARDYPYYLICRSAGNDRNDDGPGTGGGHYHWDGSWVWATDTHPPDGDYDCVGTVACAKNILTVAAVNDVIGGYAGSGSVTMSSFSSFGPADDGRIKPDISANGVSLYSTLNGSNSDYYSLSGTSMSTPNTSGSLGVLIEHWRDTHPSEGDMRSATLRGLVLHTADETGPGNGPDYSFGWGLMNTLTAAETITADVSEPIAISEQTLNNGQTYEVTVTADGGSQLRATICWTDPPGTPPGDYLDPTTKMLVNDLDLRIERVSPPATYQPWVLNPGSPGSAAITGDNNTDNVEQVVVYSPGTSQYTIRVTHEGSLSGGSQAFSLIITGGSSGCQTNGDCADGVYCNGAEICDNGECQPGTPVDCNDGVGCTDDSCNEGPVPCDNLPNDALCDNGQYCDGAETCDPLFDCQPGMPVDCNDGVDCTDDSCNEGTDSCDNLPDDGLCDNGLYCDGVETCEPALLGCQPGMPVDCNDGVDCTDDSCNEGTDSCDNLPDDGLCDNGLYCDGVETCEPALLGCQPGMPVDCNDGVDCTDDSCNEGTDSCDNLPNDGLCDNGLYCDGAETCDPLLDCQLGPDPCAGNEWCDEDEDQCVAYGNGDFDGDLDVDLRDFAAFQACFGAAGQGPCAPGNLTGSGAIDLDDLAEFVLAMTGP